MRKSVRNIFFIIGIALFVYLIIEYGIENIFNNLKKTGYWLIPVTLLWGIVYLFNTYAWMVIVRSTDKKIPFWELFKITVSGYAINYVTPVVNLGGEPYRVYALKDKIGNDNSISAVLIYSMLHWVSHFFIWIFGIIIMFTLLNIPEIIEIPLIIAFVLSGFLIFFLLFRNKKGIFKWIFNLLDKFPFLNFLYKKLKKKEDRLKHIDKNITQFYNKSRKDFYYALFLEFFGRVIASLEFYLILLSTGYHITFVDSYLIYAGASLIINIVFFIPMNLGVRESGMYFIFGLLGLPGQLGIYTALISRIREFIWILIGLIFIRLQKTGIKEVMNYDESSNI